MEEEIWKSLDFLGYPDYMVSNMGRIKSLDKYVNSSYGSKQLRKERILNFDKTKFGYLRIKLWQNGEGRKFYVHRLVASAFLKNNNNLPYINHKDENKENNHVDNLEWVTQKENINYGTRNERVSEKMKGENNPMYGKHFHLTEEHKRNIGKGNKGKKVSEETKQKISEAKKGKPLYNKRVPILQYTLDGNFVRDWESIKQASEELNLQYSNIGACCREKRKQCGGFIWKYKYPTNN